MINSQRSADTLAISPAAVTNGATSAVNIDCINADYATIRVALSNIAQATIASADGVTIKLTELEDTNPSNATTFVADKTGIKLAREVRYEVDLKARKRYLRLSVIPGTSGVTNEPVTAVAFVSLSRKTGEPSATNDMVGGSNDMVVIT